MPDLGKRNQLTVLREATPGFFLDGGSLGEILLPRKYIPQDAGIGSVIDVFLYRDSEDRIVATTETPLAMVGDFALLRVVGTRANIGAFLDWGLSKDLLLPHREQRGQVREGELVFVHVSIDEKSDRIVASQRLNRWLNKTRPTYKPNQPVDVVISGETPLGYDAVIANAHLGLLYEAELPGPLRLGEALTAYVREVRPDGKIDLSLDMAGWKRLEPLADRILFKLKATGGFLPFHDKSSPEEIRDAFGVSKKAFKQSVGVLFKKKQITIEAEGIRLTKAPSRKG